MTRRRSINPRRKAQLKARGVLRTSLDPASVHYDSFLTLTDKIARILSDAGLLVEEQDTTPELTETAAGLRYEYAVLEDVGYWRRHGEWFDTFEEATDYRDMKREDAPMRIVRRLVGDPEVVE